MSVRDTTSFPGLEVRPSVITRIISNGSLSSQQVSPSPPFLQNWKPSTMMMTAPRSNAALSVVLLAAAAATSCQAFTIQPQQRQLLKQQLSSSLKTTTKSLSKLHGSYFDDEDEDDREFARIRGGRGRRTRVMDYDDDDELLDDLEDVVNDYYNDDNEFDGVIPNPLLDNIDPEGSSERIGELFSDRQFWIDIGLLFLFLNFLDNLRDPAVFDAIDIATMQ